MNAPVLLRQLLRIPDALESCPHRLGWMRGHPPPRDKQISWHDGSAYAFPQLRWSFSHFRDLMPVVAVPRGGAIAALPRAERPEIGLLSARPRGSRTPMRWRAVLDAGYTDGIVVLHRGRVVHERYFGVLGPCTHHTAMSVTKSVVGLLGLLRVADGTLREDLPVTAVLPELKASGFAGATVGDLLDMRTALDYSEDYADPDAHIWAHVQAGQVLPRPAGWQGPEGFDAFLPTVGPGCGRHGEAFHYRTVNADALGAVLRRATGQDLASQLSSALWQPLGTESDAWWTVDAHGVPFAGGGLNTTLRDLARLGEMLRCDGAYNGRQIVPAAVVATIRGGGRRSDEATRQALPRGWSYRAMWWLTHNAHGAFMARGVHGQLLYVDPVAEMVIARFASHPTPSNAASDAASLPAWAALAELLAGR